MKTTLSLNTKIKRNSQTVFKVLNNRVYIFEADKYNLHSFNELASLIWSSAKRTISLKNLINKITDEYNINYKTCTNDVITFVNYCIRKNFFLLIH